jgi:D-aminopeptidase
MAARLYRAAPFEVDDEFGGLGSAIDSQPLTMPSNEKMAAYEAMANTTLAIVATDARLSKTQAKRLAVSAQDGIARAVVPAHTQFDGDLVFAMSTGSQALIDTDQDMVELGHAAAVCVARSIARGVYGASTVANDTLPTWQQRFSDS